MVPAEIQEELDLLLDNKIVIEREQITGYFFGFEQKKFFSADYFECDAIREFSSLKYLPDEPSLIDVTWQNGKVKPFELPLYFENNYQKFQKSFLVEIGKRDNIDTSVSRLFEKTASILSELPFLECTVEVNNMEGLKFNMLFSNNKLLMISKPMDNENSSLEQNEIIFSLFHNRELIASNASELENFKEGFKKYLSM